MSIIKFINGKNRELSQLKNILQYVDDPDKAPREYLAHTGLSDDHAYSDMLTVKVLNKKLGGRQYIHFILSFDQEVACWEAYQVGREVLAFFDGRFQVSMALHTNTRNLHLHFVINSVGFDGYKFRQSRSQLKEFKNFVNGILENYGLNPVGKIQRSGVGWLWEEDFYDCEEYYDDFEEDEEPEEVYRPIYFVERKEKEDKVYRPIWYEKKQDPIRLIQYDEEEGKSGKNSL